LKLNGLVDSQDKAPNEIYLSALFLMAA